MKQVTNRKSVSVQLQDPWHKPDEFIEVTAWANGEGYDIVICDREKISIHDTEWAVIKKIIKKLESGKL